MNPKNKKISVLVPSLRTEKLPQLEQWIRERSGVPEQNLEFLYNSDPCGFPKAFKQLVMMASHDLILFLADDCEPMDNFLLPALKEMGKFDGNWGLVGLNCGRWETKNGTNWISFLDHNEIAQHWLGHKRLLQHLDGEFFHTGYQHCYSDNELTQRCKQIKRYRYCEKSKIIHYHPMVMQDESLWDDVNKPRYENGVVNQDRMLFQRRAANGWKTPKAGSGNKQVLILVPVHGEGFQKFWTQVSRLQFKCLTSSIDTFLRVKSSSILQHSRNCLVSEGLRDFPEATHFLFVDSDMVFPDDLLIRLLEHDKDIVTINAYRKAPPFWPVVSIQGGDDDYFRPIHIKPEEGKLRRVTSGGTGIVLIKREVFEKMNFPWFQCEYVDPIAEDQDTSALIEGKMFVSEDSRFFIIASALGFGLYCDFSIEIGHIGKSVFTWRDHEQHIADKPELVKVSKNDNRNEIDHENASPGDSRDRDRQHDQPGLERRL